MAYIKESRETKDMTPNDVETIGALVLAIGIVAVILVVLYQRGKNKQEVPEEQVDIDTHIIQAGGKIDTAPVNTPEVPKVETKIVQTQAEIDAAKAKLAADAAALAAAQNAPPVVPLDTPEKGASWVNGVLEKKV